MLEKVWYELSPIIFVVASCFVVVYSNFWGVFFALILLSVSVLIGVMRIQSRSRPKVRVKTRNTAAKSIKRRI